MTEEASRFSSALPLIILTRPAGSNVDWQEVDRGPGYFTIPVDQEISVKIKGINDDALVELAADLHGLTALRFLDLSENRNVTNDGLARLKGLVSLTGMNLSSCSISDSGLSHLKDLTRLVYLNLSYCNKLSDGALKILESLRNITYVNLQGCLGITKGGLARVRRRNLEIYR